MLLLADVVRRHGPGYLRRFGARILPSHVRALDDIARCRTPALGGHVAVCNHCDEEHLLYHSCRNRACPRCGHDTASRWLARQRELLLPVPYFHVVFTLPEELRHLVRAHQRALVGALFRAAFDAVAALARDDRFLGGQIGALAVLHTWTRKLEWHPHVHMLVPAGGLAPDGRTWRPPPAQAALPGAGSRPRQALPRALPRIGAACPPRRAIPSHPLGQALGRLRQAGRAPRRAGPRVPRSLRPPHRHVRSRPARHGRPHRHAAVPRQPRSPPQGPQLAGRRDAAALPPARPAARHAPRPRLRAAPPRRAPHPAAPAAPARAARAGERGPRRRAADAGAESDDEVRALRRGRPCAHPTTSAGPRAPRRARRRAPLAPRASTAAARAPADAARALSRPRRRSPPRSSRRASGDLRPGASRSPPTSCP
jgi:hypothetical protein